MAKTKNEKRRGYCPKCGSTNVASEPIYDEEEEIVTDYIALFCITCGHYLGEVEFSLHERMHNLRANIRDLFRQDS